MSTETQSKAKAEDLVKYDILLLIDKSGSMGDPYKGGKNRWQGAEEATVAIAREAEKFDKDGITVTVFGNSKVKSYDNITGGGDKVSQIFKENSPMGGTPTADALKHHLDEYFAAKTAGKSPKPIIMVVVTDGRPDDEAAVAKVITEATKQMDNDGEIGITFVQIGNDTHAAAYLKELDDHLEEHGAKFDIVDTINLDDVENVTDLLLNALND